ncbi:iron ABC transporter permease [Streptomyces piniterrae]|uniref:Iron ABC transporter permease n=1 Tax=Streptomyces piniterrae TaxID=2571125 RepID=A0A4U0NK83_9ACTN|nr:iron chelate uptake ABC transporter family permease subunit [Streptomyces piniterrae]TJZ54182.1 iron ABC transporter permease [Streptomyces piniterrae]
MSTREVVLTRSGPSWVARVRRGSASVLFRPRAVGVSLALFALVLVLFCAGVAAGTRVIPLDDVLSGLAGRADHTTVLTVQQFRLPRVMVAVMVGAALGLSGAVVQAVTRNPIAAPDVLGVTAGASFGGVLVLLALGGTTFGYGGAAAELSQIAVPLGAIAGAFVAAAIVLVVGGSHGGVGTHRTFSTQRVVLVGIICHAAFIGLVHWGLATGDVDQAAKAAVWLVGSLHGRGWEHVTGVATALLVLLPIALLLGRRLNALALGEPSAATLGVPVARTQVGLFVVAFALTGTAAAAAGPVDFVALLAPQIAKRLVRTPGVPLVASALTGSAMVLAADLLARLAIPGVELPVGAVTALVGAPYLLWLVIRSGGTR